MFNNMNDTKIVDATPEDLLVALGESPDDQTGKGKKAKEVTDDDKGEDKTKGKNQKASKSSGKDKPATKDVSVLSDDDLDIALGIEEEEDSEEEGKNDKNKSKKSSKKDENEEDKDEDEVDEIDEQDKDDDEDEDKKEKEEKDKDEDEGDLSVGNFLKARVDLLIQKGEWVDWEGREDIEEWDEDAFAKMELQQREYQRAQLREEILDDFGPVGRQIADYTAKGGDPEDLIEIFKEQKVVENLSIESEDDQKKVVLKYATEFQGMKPERATKYVNALIADKELAEVAKEAKDSMEKELKEELNQLKATQDAQIEERKRRTRETLQKFASDVSNVINSRTDIDVEEKKQILQVLTKFDKKLKDGTPVNDFYFKLAEFRKSLPNYIDMVRFVMNPKKFIKSAENKGKTAEAEKAFRLVRTSNAKKSVKSVDVNKDEKTGKKTTGFKLL
jgi:hypothetical protein